MNDGLKRWFEHTHDRIRGNGLCRRSSQCRETSSYVISVQLFVIGVGDRVRSGLPSCGDEYRPRHRPGSEIPSSLRCELQSRAMNLTRTGCRGALSGLLLTWWKLIDGDKTIIKCFNAQLHRQRIEMWRAGTTRDRVTACRGILPNGSRPSTPRLAVRPRRARYKFHCGLTIQVSPKTICSQVFVRRNFHRVDRSNATMMALFQSLVARLIQRDKHQCRTCRNAGGGFDPTGIVRLASQRPSPAWGAFPSALGLE